jgi:hypothetical protein
MKFRRIYFWILGLVFVLSLAGSALYFQNQEAPNKVLAFVTVGIDQTQRPNETSSYELQRAAEHFSDTLLGWTLEPHFRAEFLAVAGEGYNLMGQRQEKQNLLFEITRSGENIAENDLSAGDAFLRVLHEQLNGYNAETHQGFVLAVEHLSYIDGVQSKFPIVGSVLFWFGLTALCLFAFEYASTRRRSSSAA